MGGSGTESKLLLRMEERHSPLQGTIIDIETIGDFDPNPMYRDDSRRFRRHTPVILGYLTEDRMEIRCARRNRASISHLKRKTIELLSELPRPFYAFNSIFEKSVFFHYLGLNIDFRELDTERYEKKEDAVRLLGIPQCGDPFQGVGKRCMDAWLQEDYHNAIRHNRACLLKERAILKKRGHRSADSIELVDEHVDRESVLEPYL